MEIEVTIQNLIQNSDILTKENYLIPSRYVSGRIVEYDIKAANANVMYHEGLLNESQYKYFISLPKIDREIALGNLQRQNNTIYRRYIEGILKFRQKLIETNNIQEDEIIRIAKDAIYVNRFDDLKYTKFDNVEFAKKSESSNMIQLLDLIIFSKYINNTIDIDVKGLGKNTELHQQFMLSLIANVIYMFERVSLLDSISYLTHMYEQYVKKQLPIGFYRQLNSQSGYLIPMYNMIVFEGSDLSMIDISYNITYLRELHNILFEQFH